MSARSRPRRAVALFRAASGRGQALRAARALLHAKTAVIDGVWSTVGSTNLDWRSFLDNDEVNAVILSPEFGQRMEDVFAGDLAASDAIDLAQWERRPLSVRAREWASRLWARLL